MAIQPLSALKNMKFDIKQITKIKHIVTKNKNTQKRFQPDDSGTKKLELLTASASAACFCTLRACSAASSAWQCTKPPK